MDPSNLSRPASARNMYLAVFDTETTGLDPATNDIIQFAIVVYHPRFEQPLVFESLCNPNIPIDPAAAAVHGITDEMVADARPTSVVIKELFAELFEMVGTENLVLGGHNTEFDYRFIKKHIEIPANVFPICTMRLARRKEPNATNHTLEYLYREYYKLSSPNTVKAHDALCDVWMCYELLQHWTSDLTECVDLADSLRKPVKLLTMPFGKHKGKSFKELPWHYVKWMNDQTGDMDQDVRHTVQLIVARQY